MYFGTSSDPPYDTTVSTTSASKTGLNYGTTYYWKIVSVDEHNAETTGPVWSFTTHSNSAPYTPSSPSPANGATGQSRSPTLSWTGGDPDGDSVTYDVYFGTSSNPPYDQTVSSTSISKTGLSALTTYIMPNGTFISEYYNVATRTDKRAKALLWWWYPDSYASSFETQNQQMGVLPVHNVWADQQQLWLAANLEWKP